MTTFLSGNALIEAQERQITELRATSDMYRLAVKQVSYLLKDVSKDVPGAREYLVAKGANF
jgi:hypothetical protein